MHIMWKCLGMHALAGRPRRRKKWLVLSQILDCSERVKRHQIILKLFAWSISDGIKIHCLVFKQTAVYSSSCDMRSKVRDQ